MKIMADWERFCVCAELKMFGHLGGEWRERIS